MATTTERGIPLFDDTFPAAPLQAIMNAQSSALDLALDMLESEVGPGANYYTGTSSARLAALANVTEGSAWMDTDGQRALHFKRDEQWVGGDSGWVDIPMKAGMSAQGANEKPQLRFVNNEVKAKGGWSNTGIPTGATTLVGTIPAQFRPLSTVFHRAGTSTGNAAASVLFQANGDISIRTNGTLSGYYFITGANWMLN